MYSDNGDIRMIQEHEIEMLRFLDKVCKENGLTYYVCGGTLIGAVREKGFIPWDDDIDIMMPRNDYEWLLNNRKKIFTDQKYGLYDFRVDDYDVIPRRVPAIIDKSLVLQHDRFIEVRKQYLMLDIFVLDGMPKTHFGRMLHYYHFLFIHALLQLSWYDNQVNQYRKNRPLWERIAIGILNHIRFRPRINSKRLVQKENRILAKYEYGHSEFVCSLLGPLKKKEILPGKYFETSIRLPFEDMMVNVPGHFHELLTHYYGNYMVRPQKREEKELHHRICLVD